MNYRITILTAEGIGIGVLRDWSTIEIGLTVNDVGRLRITLGSLPCAIERVVPDGLLEVWRDQPGGHTMLIGPYRWLIQRIDQQRADDGTRTIVLHAIAPLGLLATRVVRAFAGSNEASKTGRADDVIKAIAREQAGPLAAADRRIPGLIITSDVGMGVTISKAFAWRNVLTVMQEIANASAQAGSYVAFDLTTDGSGGWIFDTYDLQRGEDRRGTMVFGDTLGNVGGWTLTLDYGDEVTHVTCGGQGDGDQRLIATAQDDARIAASPYRWRERFKDATMYNESAGLSNEAHQELRTGRPRLLAQATIMQTETSRYGIAWQWGDYVTLRLRDVNLDARIDAVVIRVQHGTEDIQAALRAEGEL